MGAAIDGIDVVSLDAAEQGPDPRVGDVLVVRGWAHERGGQPDLSVILDGTLEYAVQTRLARPDVATELDDPTALECGFTISVPTIDLDDGDHTLTVVGGGPQGSRELARTQFRLASPAAPAPAELARAWFDSWTDETGNIVAVNGDSISVPRDCVVRIDGWAADTVGSEAAVAAFALVGDHIVEVAYGFERRDVAGALGERHTYSGFSFSFPTTYLSTGRTALQLTLLAADGVTLRSVDAMLTLSCAD